MWLSLDLHWTGPCVHYHSPFFFGGVYGPTFLASPARSRIPMFVDQSPEAWSPEVLTTCSYILALQRDGVIEKSGSFQDIFVVWQVSNNCQLIAWHEWTARQFKPHKTRTGYSNISWDAHVFPRPPLFYMDIATGFVDTKHKSPQLCWHQVFEDAGVL